MTLKTEAQEEAQGSDRGAPLSVPLGYRESHSFSSWSPTTLRRATEIMKRLRRKQTSQSFPTAAPHTARTTPW